MFFTRGRTETEEHKTHVKREMRARCSMPVTCADMDTDEHDFNMIMRNFSTSGIKLEGERVLPVGNHYRIGIKLPVQEEPVYAETEVVWSQGEVSQKGEIGLKFTYLDNTTEEAIKTYKEAVLAAAFGIRPRSS